MAQARALGKSSGKDESTRKIADMRTDLRVLKERTRKQAVMWGSE